MVTIALSTESQLILEKSYEKAKSSNSSEINTVHILLVLMTENRESREWLQRIGHNPDELIESIQKEWQIEQSFAFSEPEASSSYIAAMRTAQQIASSADSLLIEPQHLLQAVVNQQGNLTDFLEHQNIKVNTLLVSSKSETRLLDSIGRDLTNLARQGKLMPVIGRDHDVELLIEILLRHGKNNALLLGEAGVGKTAVAEKLAQEIAAGRVPDMLLNKRIVELNISNLVAGTSYRGQFEDKLQTIISEIQRAGDVIILIDEFHTIMNAGAIEGGASDAGNILKPALARGELTCIGITTHDEYTKFIEQDAALVRRFQVLIIDEPSADETIQMLVGIKSRYEAHHNLVIDSGNLKVIVDLSIRYLPSRRLPDKAIDILASAASRAQIRQMDVTPNLIAEIISGMAGIPVTQVNADEARQLSNLESILSKRVVGQDMAIQAVARAVRIARVGLKDERKPTGVFMFVGPTGVGKTELARVLAEVLFGSEQALIRFDMSEFSEKHSISRLIGSPPGYIGYENAGQLTQSLREHPYSVVLFDEVEKAHPEVFDLFLQLFDEGRLTDTHGRLADGRNAIFILTSNIGSDRFTSKKHIGFGGSSSIKTNLQVSPEDVIADLKSYFRVEFLNRIDQIVVFSPLNMYDLRKVAQIQIAVIIEQLKDREVSLSVDDAALDYLGRVAQETSLGARALKRLIQQEIITPISDRFVASYDNPPHVIRVVLEGDLLKISWA